jgi:hypothetical protein
MQMKIQRSQRMRGVVGNTVFFCLDVRAEYSSEERDNIRKYKLGPQVVYNSRAARKHIDRAGDQFDRTQERDLKGQVAGLARGAFSLALAKMSLNISIASLERGHHIECKDLDELLEAEDAVRHACKSVTAISKSPPPSTAAKWSSNTRKAKSASTLQNTRRLCFPTRMR